MNRYEDCDESLVSVFLRVVEERFPSYGNLKFKLVYDLKRRVKNGKILLASIEPASAKIKYFSKDDNAVDGYDYVLTVDRLAWDRAEEDDRIRLISHQLCHVFVDEMGKCKKLPHDISDFAVEVERNKDKPNWHINLSMLVDDIYGQEKDMKKSKKEVRS